MPVMGYWSRGKMMKIRDYIVMTGTACALTAAMQGFAQTDEPEETEPAIVEMVEQALEQDAARGEKGFDLLVRALSVSGAAEVKNPDTGAFAPMLKNKAYPLGSVFRTGAGGTAVVVFSGAESVQMFENTEVVVLASKDNAKGRCVRLVSGRIKTFLKDNLPEGQFGVETPNASCKNMAGRADFSLTMEGENERFQAATITGTVRIEGPQYTIGALRAANTVNVLTAPNRSLSHLTGVSGDYKITLDNETDNPVVYDMSPKAVVKIWREAASVGGNMVVSTLVVSPTGKAKHRISFVVGRPNIFPSEDEVPEVEAEPELPNLLQATAKEKAPAKKAKAAADDDAAAEEEDAEQ